jgi:hypothetical protein
MGKTQRRQAAETRRDISGSSLRVAPLRLCVGNMDTPWVFGEPVRLPVGATRNPRGLRMQVRSQQFRRQPRRSGKGAAVGGEPVEEPHLQLQHQQDQKSQGLSG